MKSCLGSRYWTRGQWICLWCIQRLRIYMCGIPVSNSTENRGIYSQWRYLPGSIWSWCDNIWICPNTSHIMGELKPPVVNIRKWSLKNAILVPRGFSWVTLFRVWWVSKRRFHDILGWRKWSGLFIIKLWYEAYTCMEPLNSCWNSIMTITNYIIITHN